MTKQQQQQTRQGAKRKFTWWLIYEFVSVVLQSIISVFVCTVYIISLYMTDGQRMDPG